VRRPRIDILTIEGCPNTPGARELVERIAAELTVRPEIAVITVLDDDAARRLRFPGSPTVRVDGRDVEPGVAAQTEFGVMCRLYRTRDGTTGCPDPDWIRGALGVGRS
jgi:hypothetical protein